jgi:hypothetical protein
MKPAMPLPRRATLFAAVASLAFASFGPSCKDTSSNTTPTPGGDGGGPSPDSGAGGDDAGPGDDASPDAPAGPCTPPTAGYHGIGPDITDTKFVALYIIGKGADTWEARVGRVTIDGAPLMAPFPIASFGDTMFGANVGGLFTAVNTAPLAFTKMGTYAPPGSLEMIAAAGANRLVLALSGGEIRCLDLPSSEAFAGYLPAQNPPIIVNGLSGTCGPLSGSSGSFDIAGVDISGPPNQFKFFGATLSVNTPGAGGTFSFNPISWTRGSARGAAEKGTLTISTDAPNTLALVQAGGGSPSAIRSLRLCAPGAAYHGKAPPVVYFTD